MDGILPLWKERGLTSHDCVFKLRKILKMKKIGHGGTLDPDVDGVLPICIGKGTKVIEFMQDNQKIYEGEITLGFATTTEDASGDVVERTAVTAALPEKAIDTAMAKFVGTITQIPPMYSAVKVNGRKLYEYARAGEMVERPQRKAEIKTFERVSQPKFDTQTNTQSWRFRVVCGKGTYVRTLAVDLGAALGYPAHMSDLTRTASGGFVAGQAVTLTQVADLVASGKFATVLQPLENAVADFPRVELDDALWQKVKNGQMLPAKDFSAQLEQGSLLAFFYHEKLVSLYEAHPEKKAWLKPRKVIRNEVGGN
ncbi:tRNA pseudouridine(55) synthase TruB [Enterococcus sp. CSURQ0835]|uniref:tRNA pseudouridine(55) synthase TruB n=1 Tax=Enterococcus sp. CSURQ0835 TaxID=2681394 RepID=UPI00135B8214|nr:tRNA pseudouridine(55) synthase TruB [Enterococcus sp. CSURQ0835]